MRVLFAYFVLLAFPFLTSYLFRRYPAPTATVMAVLLGTFFLPENVAIDLPLIPPMGKDNVTYLSVLFSIVVYHRTALKAARPGRGPEAALIFLMLLGNIGTMVTNMQPLFVDGSWQDAIGPYWLFAMTLDDVLNFGIPFFVGRAMVRSTGDLVTLFRLFTAIGLIYAVLVLIEVLMTIPFFSWHFAPYFYGYQPNVSIRWGRDQPVVFVQHGLELAGLMASAAIAAAAYSKAKLPATQFGFKTARLSLLSAVVMVRNVAGNVFAWSVNIAFWLLTPRMLVRGAFLLVFFAISYPTLRSFDVLPVEYVVDTAFEFDEERGMSIAGRFGEEDFVINQEGGRQWLGWGDIARMPGALTYDTFNENEGGLDGWWTVMTAARGFVGMFLTFLLLAIPVFLASRRMKSTVDGTTLCLVAGLMFIIGIRMVDLLLNGWWNNLPLFLSGALFGAVSLGNSTSVNNKLKENGKPIVARRRPLHY